MWPIIDIQYLGFRGRLCHCVLGSQDVKLEFEE